MTEELKTVIEMMIGRMEIRVFWIVDSPSGLQAFNHSYDARAYCYRTNMPQEKIICVREVK